MFHPIFEELMSFYKKVKKAVNGKWYPQGVTVGPPVGTEEIARQLAQLTSLSRGDVYCVLAELGGVMAHYMAGGQTVKLDGIGTFYYTPDMKGQGVDTREEVSARQIRGTHVRFTPECRRAANKKVTARALVPRHVDWIDIEILGAGGEGQ